MPAIDTNILVRFLTADNAVQYSASCRLFASEQIFIPDTVLLEAAWVLRAAYGMKPPEVSEALRGICGLQNVALSNAELVARVLAWHDAGLDFADAYHLALSQDQESLKTFDRDFIKRATSLGECRDPGLRPAAVVIVHDPDSALPCS